MYLLTIFVGALAYGLTYHNWIYDKLKTDQPMGGPLISTEIHLTGFLVVFLMLTDLFFDKLTHLQVVMNFILPFATIAMYRMMAVRFGNTPEP